jgi:hypothetical protein
MLTPHWVVTRPPQVHALPGEARLSTTMRLEFSGLNSHKIFTFSSQTL